MQAIKRELMDVQSISRARGRIWTHNWDRYIEKQTYEIRTFYKIVSLIFQVREILIGHVKWRPM